MQATQALLLTGGEQKTHPPLMMSPAHYSGVNSPGLIIRDATAQGCFISPFKKHVAYWCEGCTGCPPTEPPQLRIEMYCFHFLSQQIRNVFWDIEIMPYRSDQDAPGIKHFNSARQALNSLENQVANRYQNPGGSSRLDAWCLEGRTSVRFTGDQFGLPSRSMSIARTPS